MFIFDNLLTFVISHEVGHFYHEHGKRFTTNNVILDDVEGHRKINTNDLVSSHARELAADNYAFDTLLDNIENTIQTHIRSFSPLFKEKNGSVILTILIISCYFQMMDGSSGHEHFNSTHPEAAMRGCSVMATYVENLKEGEENKVSGIFAVVIDLLTNIFSTLDVEYKFDWAGRMAEPKMKLWHFEVFNECSKWVK